MTKGIIIISLLLCIKLPKISRISRQEMGQVKGAGKGWGGGGWQSRHN